MKIAHEEVWDMAPAMASLIGVQCGRVQELTAHAPVEKRVLAGEKTAHEGPSDIGTAMSSLIGVHCVTVEERIAHAPVEKEVLANEMRPMKS